MGWALGWAAFRDMDRAAVLENLGLREVEGVYDYSDDTAYGVGDLPGGWTLVVSRDCESFVDAQGDRAWSWARHMVAVGIEEHVMFSAAAAWRDSAQLWRILHHPDDGIDLETSGALPVGFEAVRDELMSKQEGVKHVDYLFDIPLEVAKGIVGFRLEEIDLEEVLRRAELSPARG